MKKTVKVIVHYAPLSDEVEVEVDDDDSVDKAIELLRMNGHFDRSGVRIATKVERW